jgi:hypothetical protein
MGIFSKMFKKPVPVQDISAREADLLSTASQLISGEPEEFTIFWNDIARIIRNKTNMSPLRRVEINLTKYKSLIRKFNLTDVLVYTIPTHIVKLYRPWDADHKFLAHTKADNLIFNHDWLESFICTRIKERGFKTEIKYIKIHEQYTYVVLDQILVIEW